MSKSTKPKPKQPEPEGQWALKQDRKRKMSAVVRGDGTVVCGSLICQQSDSRIYDEHALIVEAANKHRKTDDDPLAPSASLLVKLGSIAVHTDEMHDYRFDSARTEFTFDLGALFGLLHDVEVQEWLKKMTAMAFVPVKRNAR